MNNLNTVVLVLGVGSLGYFLIQGYQKSDGSFTGMLKTLQRDLSRGYCSSRDTVVRVYSALRAGAQDTQPELATVPVASSRGNGGNPPKDRSIKSPLPSDGRDKPSTVLGRA